MRSCLLYAHQGFTSAYKALLLLQRWLTIAISVCNFTFVNYIFIVRSHKKSAPFRRYIFYSYIFFSAVLIDPYCEVNKSIFISDRFAIHISAKLYRIAKKSKLHKKIVHSFIAKQIYGAPRRVSGHSLLFLKLKEIDP